MMNKHIDVIGNLIEDYTYGVEHNHNSITEMRNCEFCIQSIISFRKNLISVLLMEVRDVIGDVVLKAFKVWKNKKD